MHLIVKILLNCASHALQQKQQVTRRILKILKLCSRFHIFETKEFEFTIFAAGKLHHKYGNRKSGLGWANS